MPRRCWPEAGRLFTSARRKGRFGAQRSQESQDRGGRGWGLRRSVLDVEKYQAGSRFDGGAVWPAVDLYRAVRRGSQCGWPGETGTFSCGLRMLVSMLGISFPVISSWPGSVAGTGLQSPLTIALAGVCGWLCPARHASRSVLRVPAAWQPRRAAVIRGAWSSTSYY